MNDYVTQKEIEAHLGEVMTARELKRKCGYSPSTYIGDTVLWHRGWLRIVSTGYRYQYEIIRGQQF